MRIFASLAACVMLSGTAPAGVTTSAVRMNSSALGGETEYVVALPDPLAAGRKYPVLYLLHGAQGNSRDWTARTNAVQIFDRQDLIVVMPDGGQFGWYTDSSESGQPDYETFVISELIEDVEKRFPVRVDAEGRAIAGLSMGGHGALSLAAKHPNKFGSASSMSGILHLQNHPGKWELDSRFGELEKSSEAWEAASVHSLVDRFASASVALLFDTGTEDATGCVRDNRQVHERLTNRAIEHTYREYPGGHTWEYWEARLPEHVKFHKDVISKRDSGSTVPAGRRVLDRFHDIYTSRSVAFERENVELLEAKLSTGPVVLLGSSTFHGFKSELLPNFTVANRGISADRIGLTSRGLLHRLYCSAIDMKPRAVFINNGTNDLGALSRAGSPTVEKTAEGFGEVVRRIRAEAPQAYIFIVSCHATRDDYDRIAPFIKPYNEAIRKFADQGDPMVRYVDHYSDTVGPDDRLKAEYSRDGLHLNAEGYKVLANHMLDALAGAGLTPDKSDE